MTAPNRNASAPSLHIGGRTFGAGGGHRFGVGMAPVRLRSPRATLRRLGPRVGPHAGTIAFVLLFVVAGTAATLSTPWIIGRAIEVLRRHPPTARDDLKRLSILLIAAYGTGFASTWIQSWFMVGVSQKIIARLRSDVFSHLQRLPLRFFDTRPAGDILSRFQNDLDSLSNSLSQNGVQLLGSVLSVGGALVLMLAMDARLALAALLPVPVGFYVTTRIAKATHRHFSDQSRELGRLSGLAEETVGGLAVVRAFGREQRALDEFRLVNDRLSKAGTRAQTFSGILPPMMGLVNNLSFACATLFGGWLVLRGHASLGAITAFTLLTRQFARPLSEVSNQFNLIQASLAGVERVFEVMDESPEKEDPQGRFPSRPLGHVEFLGAGFAYRQGVPVLRDVHLEAKPGATVALVGPTGSGKTTLVNLLARFYDLDEGAIRIDGVDVRDIDRHHLRRHLGIVLQDTHLFTGTVRDNLLFGNPTASEEQMREAARLANAEPFIQRLCRGYDTLITEAGAALSQGERQLLTIARAFLADPVILVLDEATSNVDTRTELHIQEGMRALRRGRTSFVVAHRLSTIRQADSILVLDKGRIAERGNHAQLISQGGLYAQLHANQSA